MSTCERNGSTTRYEPPGSPRRAASDARVTTSPPAPSDDPQLFADGPGPRLFGEGSYSTGGSPAEGNYAAPDTNPQGGYGSFDDAGGFGATQLLGEHRRAAERAEEPDHAAEIKSES